MSLSMRAPDNAVRTVQHAAVLDLLSVHSSRLSGQRIAPTSLPVPSANTKPPLFSFWPEDFVGRRLGMRRIWDRWWRKGLGWSVWDSAFYRVLVLTSLSNHNWHDLMIWETRAVNTNIPIRLEWSAYPDKQEDRNRREKDCKADQTIHDNSYFPRVHYA